MFRLFVLAIVATSVVAAYGEDPWADSVAAYNAIDANPGFEQPSLAIGEPVAGTMSAPSNASIHSIGTPGSSPGSYITLKFNTPIENDPLNPMGLDFIVYGNAFWVGGNDENKWIEAGLVEVSQDTNDNGIADDPWYVMPGSREYDASVLPTGTANPTPSLAGFVSNPGSDDAEGNWGYADLSPTQQKYLDNYVRPDDPFTVGLTPRSGGGDAFDIAWAEDSGGNPANLSQIDFVRVSAFLQTPGGFIGDLTPEIDAIADVAPDVDTDGDGILDDFETRVAGTDPARPESTVLALEIPTEDGGSPSGTELGTAEDAMGNAMTLISSGSRTGTRAFNTVVDILDAPDPDPATPIAGMRKSTAVREFSSDIVDFQTADIQNPRYVIAYTDDEISQVVESSLLPYRYTGSTFVLADASATVDTEANTVTFRSRYSGTFVLAGSEATGAGGDIFVDFAHMGAESGSESQPWNTLTEAINNATPGDTIRLNGASSDTETSETFVDASRISTALTLRADPSGGGVRIGVPEVKGSRTDSSSATSMASEESVSFEIDLVEPHQDSATKATEYTDKIWYEKTTYARTIPARKSDDTVRIADGQVALRVRTASPILPRSWTVANSTNLSLTWQPNQEKNDYWIIGEILSRASAGENVWLESYARTRFGEETYARVIGQIVSPHDMTADVYLEPDPHVPALPIHGLGTPIRIAPEQVFESPQTITIPLPANADPTNINLYYYQKDPQDQGWYPAQNITGWLVQRPNQTTTTNGQPIIQFQANHTATLQIGTP